MKGIYEEEDEIELKGATKTVDPLEEKEAEVVTENGDVNESDGELVPVEYSGSSAKCIVKEQGLDEGELDQQTASALNIRYRVFNDTAIRTAIDSEKNVWFVAFAPSDSPTVAVALMVENGDSGGGTAAPKVGAILKEAFR